MLDEVEGADTRRQDITFYENTKQFIPLSFNFIDFQLQLTNLVLG